MAPNRVDKGWGVMLGHIEGFDSCSDLNPTSTRYIYSFFGERVP